MRGLAAAQLRLGILALSMLALCQIGGFQSASAAITERVVSNRNTGLAISGFDPVSYFTDAAVIPGRAELEASQGGAVWRFSNENNRLFFLAHPEIYAPRFGGYDPVDLARGAIVPGRPQLWLIVGQRLYLFSRQENRDAFASAPIPLSETAGARWPVLSATLADY